jgi:hypothetical protein
MLQTGNGQCLFVDELSGDFRANLTPIQVKACDSSAGQQWDIITSGKHDNVPGAMLIVSSLVSKFRASSCAFTVSNFALRKTQACANFDGRRAAGNQVLLFSCGGRGDGCMYNISKPDTRESNVACSWPSDQLSALSIFRECWPTVSDP